MLLSVNEDIWPGWYLVMFGLFYHTEYKTEDTEALKEGMLDGIITSFFPLQGAAYVFRSYDVVRYKGIYSNCNINALFYGIVWVAFLIRLYDIRKKKEKMERSTVLFICRCNGCIFLYDGLQDSMVGNVYNRILLCYSG
ncbi:MAG: hypothetical protein HDQ96_12110 [Lachnospiraceae bacterium]|nr:hypothetical protein [Lachnospiraceae bacterium]